MKDAELFNVELWDEKTCDTCDINLRALNQHLLGVDIIPLTLRICLGAARKPKLCVLRL